MERWTPSERLSKKEQLLMMSPPAKLAPVSTEITGVRAPVGGGRDGARRARLVA
jgi:hypothetical protein